MIVPVNPGLCLAVIDPGALILNFRAIRQRTEASGEAGRRPYYAPVCRRALYSNPFPQLRGSFTDINRNQECGTLRYAHEFTHGRRPLKVQTSHDPPVRSGVII